MAIGVLISLGLAAKVAAVAIVAKIINRKKQPQNPRTNRPLKNGKVYSQENQLAERKKI